MTTQTKHAHTPTPWEVEKIKLEIENGDELTYEITYSVRPAIDKLRDCPEQKANAQFIVCAVNAHDELVECVRKAVECGKRLEDYYNNPIIAPNGKAEGMCLYVKTLKSMEDVLAKAGE